MKPLILSLLLLLSLSVAAEQPASSPVTIEADRMELDQARGTSHYRGHVVLVQGTLQIKADSITLHTLKGRLHQAVADGDPVSLVQQGDGSAGPLRAEAAHMEYLPQSEAIKLSGKARLWRDGNEFSGEQISYDLQQQLVKASGDKQGDGRVRVLLQPGSEQPETEKPE